MSDFDKIFEEAPTVDDFDKMFEEAPEAVEQPKKGIAQKAKDLAKSSVELASDVSAPVTEGALDFSLGAAQGLTLGFADEIAARAGQLLDPLISRLSGEAELNEQLRQQGFQVEQPETTYEQELKRTRAEFDRAEKESKWLYGGGYLGGSIASGQALGGALNLATKGTRLAQLAQASKAGRIGKMAVEGALGAGIEAIGSSEGSIMGTPEQQEQLTDDIATNAGIGAIAGGGMGTLGEVAVPAAQKLLKPVTEAVGEFVEDTPFLKGLGRSFKTYGMEYGVSPTSQKAIQEGVPGVEGGTPFSQLNLKRTGEIIENLEKNRGILGKKVEEAIENNTDLKLNMSEPVRNFATNFEEAIRTLPSLGKDEKIIDILNQFSRRNFKSLNPKETKAVMDDITNIVKRIDSSKYSSMELEQMSDLLKGFRKDLDLKLKVDVPDYGSAASNYTKFMSSVYEQPIAGKYSADDVFYADLKDPKLKLTKAYEKLVEGTSDLSDSAIQTSFSNLSVALKKLQEEGVPINFESKDFLKKLKDYSVDAEVRRAVLQTQESTAGAKQAAKLMTGLGETGKAWSYLGAQKAGKYVGKPIANISKRIFNIPNTQLLPLANRLEQIEGVGFLGKALKEGIATNDSFKKNAALFSILQNPSAKLLIDSIDSEDEWE